MAAKNTTASANMKMSELGISDSLEAGLEPRLDLTGRVQCFDAKRAVGM